MSCPQYLFHYLGFLVLIGRSKLGKEVMHLLRINLKYIKNIITKVSKIIPIYVNTLVWRKYTL